MSRDEETRYAKARKKIEETTYIKTIIDILARLVPPPRMDESDIEGLKHELLHAILVSLERHRKTLLSGMAKNEGLRLLAAGAYWYYLSLKCSTYVHLTKYLQTLIEKFLINTTDTRHFRAVLKKVYLYLELPPSMKEEFCSIKNRLIKYVREFHRIYFFFIPDFFITRLESFIEDYPDLYASVSSITAFSLLYSLSVGLLEIFPDVLSSRDLPKVERIARGEGFSAVSVRHLRKKFMELMIRFFMELSLDEQTRLTLERDIRNRKETIQQRKEQVIKQEEERAMKEKTLLQTIKDLCPDNLHSSVTYEVFPKEGSGLLTPELVAKTINTINAHLTDLVWFRVKIEEITTEAENLFGWLSVPKERDIVSTFLHKSFFIYQEEENTIRVQCVRQSLDATRITIETYHTPPFHTIDIWEEREKISWIDPQTRRLDKFRIRITLGFVNLT